LTVVARSRVKTRRALPCGYYVVPVRSLRALRGHTTLPAMRIQFCGADRTVTGSCHLIEVNGLRILLDLGMYQGPREQARQFNQYLPLDIKDIDAIVLSHGHLDHCGKLPVATRAGFERPIYCTPATAEVARIVLEDAAEIQLEDAQYLSQRARDPNEPRLEPLYEPADIPQVLKLFKRVQYDVRTDLGNGVSFTFRDAGHILGSAYVVLEWEEAGKPRKLLFTADVGRYNSPIIRDPVPPPGSMDLIISESTYGNTDHADMANVEPQLLDAVRYCVEHKSRLIVPSFAVGRTQVILWYMQKFISEKKIPAVPIFVDSPMGVEASKVHTLFRDNYDEQTKQMIGDGGLFGASQVTFAASRDQSKAINSQAGACVIIASSPTLEFGRVLHHVKASIERPDDMIIFVGWTPPNTLGRRLQDGRQGSRVRIYDRWYEMKCQVRTIHGLSAHADGDELLKFLQPALAPHTTAYIVHGEVPQAEGFAARLLKTGIASAHVPAMETSVIRFSAPEVTQSAPLPGKTDND
jgi:metallo-beta-lactamase family protein